MDAQSSRGLEIDKCGWATKVKNYVTFSFPLLFRVISKGQSISLAMHYYKLDFSVKRTAYKAIKASRLDVYFIAANIVGKACILAEGDAKNRKDIIYLEALPVFPVTTDR